MSHAPVADAHHTSSRLELLWGQCRPPVGQHGGTEAALLLFFLASAGELPFGQALAVGKALGAGTWQQKGLVRFGGVQADPAAVSFAGRLPRTALGAQMAESGVNIPAGGKGEVGKS